MFSCMEKSKINNHYEDLKRLIRSLFLIRDERVGMMEGCV